MHMWHVWHHRHSVPVHILLLGVLLLGVHLLRVLPRGVLLLGVLPLGVLLLGGTLKPLLLFLRDSSIMLWIPLRFIKMLLIAGCRLINHCEMDRYIRVSVLETVLKVVYFLNVVQLNERHALSVAVHIQLLAETLLADNLRDPRNLVKALQELNKWTPFCREAFEEDTFGDLNDVSSLWDSLVPVCGLAWSWGRQRRGWQ